MTVYRRRLKKKLSKKWTCEFSYRGKHYRQAGFMSRDLAVEWQTQQLAKLQRGEYGLVRARNAAQVLPLIDSFIAYLESINRDAMYVYTMKKRLVRLAGEAGWLVVGDITADSFTAWRSRPHEFHGKPIGSKTRNQFLDSATTFCGWLVNPEKALTTNPMHGVIRLKTSDNKFYRRAATMDEVNQLLAHSPAERRLFYVFLLYTPLRMKAIRGLVWSDVDLDAERPRINLPAKLSKAGKDERHPLRLDVAQQLRIAKKTSKAKQGDRLFPTPPTLPDLKDDLAAAGVAFERDGKHRLDFHAFRKTFVGMMKRAGITLDVAHAALGHADVRTTQRYYNDEIGTAPISDAIERLPAVEGLRVAK